MLGFDQLIPFLVAALALNLTPGADMTYVMVRSATAGRRAGIYASFGIATGSFIHSVLAAIGVSVLLARSPAAFTLLKILGALYLCYLAWKCLAHGVAGRTALARANDPRAGIFNAYFEGILTNLLNPKVALFVLAFLPQFVDPAQGGVATQILILGLIFNIGGTIVNCIVACFASTAARGLSGSKRLRAWLDRCAAAVFVYLAIRLALARAV